MLLSCDMVNSLPSVSPRIYFRSMGSSWGLPAGGGRWALPGAYFYNSNSAVTATHQSMHIGETLAYLLSVFLTNWVTVSPFEMYTTVLAGPALFAIGLVASENSSASLSCCDRTSLLSPTLIRFFAIMRPFRGKRTPLTTFSINYAPNNSPFNQEVMSFTQGYV